MKRQAAVLCAALLALTPASCSTDNGNGGVFGTIRAVIEDAEDVTETVTAAAPTENTTAALSQNDDAAAFNGVLKGITTIKQGADTKIEFDGRMKDIAGYSDIRWLLGSGETYEKSIPAEVVGGTIKALDIRDIIFDEMTDGAASGQIDYWVFLVGEMDGIVYVLSNVIESSIVFNDDTGGAEDVPSFITAVMAADDLAHEPEFLDEMRVRSFDGEVFKAKPADAHEEYYYGRDADESGFHIVITSLGTVQCIGRSGEYDGSDAVIAIMHNGSDVTLFKADIENGVVDIHGEDDAEEGIYSVFVVDSIDGDLRRLSNILEYQLVRLT